MIVYPENFRACDCRLRVRLYSAWRSAGNQEGRLMLFPDIHNDKIAFVYGGDSGWRQAREARRGALRRIRAASCFRNFRPMESGSPSPGQYDGNFNVYVMPADGGQPDTVDLLSGIGAAAQRPHGHTQRSDRLDAGQQERRFSFRGAMLRTAGPSGLIRSASMAGCRNRWPWTKADCFRFRRMAQRSLITGFSATSGQWKRYTGGMAQDITIYDVKNNVVDADHSAHGLHRHVSDVAWEHDLFHLRSRARTPAESLQLRPRPASRSSN